MSEKHESDPRGTGGDSGGDEKEVKEPSENPEDSRAASVYATEDGGTEAGSVEDAHEDPFFVMGGSGRSREGYDGMEAVWRCSACGKMGSIDSGGSGQVPDGCASCGAPKEYLYYCIED